MDLNRKGISPLISFALTVAIIITAVTTVWVTAQPVLQKSEEAAIIAESKNILSAVDDAIKDVAFESKGSSRLVSITVTGGIYKANANDDSFDFELDTTDQLIEGTAQTKAGNLYAAGARDVETFEANVSGVQSLVLENSHTLLAIRKFNKTTVINSSDLIVQIRHKDENHNVTPDESNVTLNDLSTTRNGTGFTEFVDNGTKYGKGQIRARINSDAGINYSIIFTLPSNADYFIIEIENVSGATISNVTTQLTLNIGGDDVQTEGEKMAISHSPSEGIVSALVFRGSSFISRDADSLGGGSRLEIKQGFDNNRVLAAFAKGTNSAVEDADFNSILKWAGTIGFATPQDAKYFAWLYYPFVDIINNERLAQGSYQLSIYNNGTSGGRVQIEISVI